MENIRKNNSKKIIIAHLSINSIRNEFNFLADIVKDNIDILMISESKLNDSFPDSQFLIEGFGEPFRLDRNRNGGGIKLFIRSDIPTKVISTDKNPFEIFYVELNFRKKKWLLSCSYSPNNNNIESHLNCLSRSIDSLSSKYENIILLDNFNSCMDDSPMIGFGETYKLRNQVKHPTCFKNPENPSCIDLLLRNKSLSFQTTTVIEAGLPDFYEMIVTVMKMHFPKMKPRVIRYRKYKIFNNDAFVNTLRKELIKQEKVLDEKELDAFSESCTYVLDKHAAQKAKQKNGI